MPVRILFLATLAAVISPGQSVVSARSGVIHFSEGEVYLADAPVQYKAGKFPEIREGSELRTNAGRVEILLTPGMILRVGPDSSIRMVSASLIDTRVEFRYGSAVIDVSEDPGNTVARINFHNYVIRFPKRGSFRIDSLPREFRVFEGEAEVEYINKKCILSKGQMMALYGGLEPESVHRSLTDGLDEWSMRRDQQLAAENPPPGDLNGDSTLAPMLDPFYGLSSFSSTFPIPAYGTGYISPFTTFNPYGAYNPYSIYNPYGYYGNPYGYYGIYQPYPIGIYRPYPIGGYRPYSTYTHVPSRPFYSPPLRPPAMGSPRPVGGGRSASPAHSIGRGR
jgi:FecR protein